MTWRESARVPKGAAVRRKTRIILSVVSGVLAAALTLGYATQMKSEAEKARQDALESYGGDVTRVCVATRQIEPGDVIDEGNVAVEDWVSSLLPPDAATSISQVAGKVATTRIARRSVVCPVHFESTDNDALDVPAGSVAVSVASDAEHALGGALERGDNVDVYISKDALADRLCAAKVLDTSALQAGGGDITWVTLAVSPDRVCELLSAASRAPVTLAAAGSGVQGRQHGDGA